MKLNCLEDLRINAFLSRAKDCMALMGLLTVQVAPGRISCRLWWAGQRPGGWGKARDDGSLKMARGVNIASHGAFHLLSFLLAARFRPTTYISFTSKVRHAGRKPFGKTQVTVFPCKGLMILGHRTKRTEVLALPLFKRSRSEKWKATNVGLEVTCWSPPSQPF